MEIIGYSAAILIGISLGLIGGGGSILTVPVLVYLFAVDTVLATTYSLFVVGGTSLVGSFSYFKKGLIDLKTALYFGLPSIIAVFITRHFLLPVIPDDIFQWNNFIFSKAILLMLLFAVLMILASYSMIKNKEAAQNPSIQASTISIMIQGIAIGMITGLVGAGGGFLIIPALVKFLKLPIKMAIGTSLLIISTNSLAGFGFSIGASDINWHFLLTITTIAVVGIFIGSFLSTKIDGKKLKPAFGWFVLAMGIYILVKETLTQFNHINF